MCKTQMFLINDNFRLKSNRSRARLQWSCWSRIRPAFVSVAGVVVRVVVAAANYEVDL